MEGHKLRDITSGRMCSVLRREDLVRKIVKFPQSDSKSLTSFFSESADHGCGNGYCSFLGAQSGSQGTRILGLQPLDTGSFGGAVQRGAQ